MTKKITFGKVSIVVFLTALIWVWADLAQDEQLSLPGVVVEVAKSSNPALWVCFETKPDRSGLQTSVALESVVLKGPARRVAEVRRQKNRGELDLSLFLTPEREGMTKTDTRTLEVLDFLKRSEEIRHLKLTVVDCEPKQLTLRVQELVKTLVRVECAGLDPSVRVKALVPDTVEVYVPPEEAGIRKAIIGLSRDEQDLAKTGPLAKTPYIELVPGQRRDVATEVKVTLAPAENLLVDAYVPAVLGLCFSQNTQGKYQVIWLEDHDPTRLANVQIQATPQARDLYAKMNPQLILYIQDEDRQATGPITREVEFHFPLETYRAGEIRANQAPPTVRFRLESTLPERSTASTP